MTRHTLDSDNEADMAALRVPGDVPSSLWLQRYYERGLADAAVSPVPLIDRERLEAAVYEASFSAQDDATETWIGFEEVTRRIADAYERAKP